MSLFTRMKTRKKVAFKRVLSLHARLILAIVLVATLGLFVAGFCTHAIVSRNLNQQSEEQLVQSAPAAVNALSRQVRENAFLEAVSGSTEFRRSCSSSTTSGSTTSSSQGTAQGSPQNGQGTQGSQSLQGAQTTQNDAAEPDADDGGGPGPGGPNASGGLSAILVTNDDEIRACVYPPVGGEGMSIADVPQDALDAARAGQRTNFKTQSLQGYVIPVQDSTDVVVLAVDSAQANATIASLLRAELIVGASVLVLVGLLSGWIVRVGLSPLRTMTKTANAIASGKADERVPRGGGTEVDSLAVSLNEAFDARAKSEQRIRSFVADASHELRTPLTAILGYAQVIERGMIAKPEQVQESAGRIGQAAVRMSGMISDLLQLARMDTKRALELAPIDLSRIAAEASHDMKAAQPQREIRVQALRPAVALADAQQIRQVLANLLGNVRDHTDADVPVEIVVTADTESAIMRVSDFGPGIAPENRTKVFDRFWRADAAHSAGRNGSHSGLGLAIVAAIIEGHNGTIEVLDTIEGGLVGARGATFEIKLPLAPDQLEEHPAHGIITPAQGAAQERR